MHRKKIQTRKKRAQKTLGQISPNILQCKFWPKNTPRYFKLLFLHKFTKVINFLIFFHFPISNYYCRVLNIHFSFSALFSSANIHGILLASPIKLRKGPPYIQQRPLFCVCGEDTWNALKDFIEMLKPFFLSFQGVDRTLCESL